MTKLLILWSVQKRTSSLIPPRRDLFHSAVCEPGPFGGYCHESARGEYFFKSVGEDGLPQPSLDGYHQLAATRLLHYIQKCSMQLGRAYTIAALKKPATTRIPPTMTESLALMTSSPLTSSNHAKYITQHSSKTSPAIGGNVKTSMANSERVSCHLSFKW
jgi:hypothetical protein